MAIAQYTQRLLANIPLAYDSKISEFYDTMLMKVPSSHRMEFIAEIIEQQRGRLPTINWSNGKNDEKSQQFRHVGNQCFRKMEFVEALKWYNKAASDENLGLCYANRSAAYYELSLFQTCLENIEFGRRSKLRDRVKEKLIVRQKTAREEMFAKLIDPQQNRNPIKSMKLSRPAKHGQPFYIDCLSKQNDDLITSDQLRPGEIISSEIPYSQLLSQSHIYERCTYCLTNKKYLSMYPCPNCSSAMFCNAWCYGMASKIFHRFECSIIDGLFDLLPDYMYLGLRTVFTGLHECHGSMDEYMNRLTRCFNNDSDPLEVNVTSGNQKEKVFLMIHNLSRSFKFSMQHHVATVLVAEKLKSTFGSLFDRDATTSQLLSTSIFHMLQISEENSILLEETAFSGDSVGNDINYYRCGLFPFASNFKLSCAPNVLLLNDNGTMLGIALRTIISDEKIVPGIMSRNHFLTDIDSRNERMWAFNRQLCHCTACEDDLELYTDISQFTVMPRQFTVMRQIPKTCSTFVVAANAVKFVYHYLNKHPHLPYLSREMGWSTQEFIRLLRQLVEAYDTDLVFTEYSKLVQNV